MDFGDCGYGYYLYDMGVTLLMLRGLDPDGSQRAAFLRGYREVRDLPEAHEALLPLFTAARAAAFVRWTMGNDAMRTDFGREWSADALGWMKEWIERRGTGLAGALRPNHGWGSRPAPTPPQYRRER